MINDMAKSYKTTKKYKCPYCDKKELREDLISHVEKSHKIMIPENYTPSRVVYESINKKDHGVCMICKTSVYEWDEKLERYKNLCSNPECRATVRERALNNHIKVYNKPTLLNDPEHQEKMLANRKISGKYTFKTDGVSVTYTGQYEKKLLEFMDQVLNIEGKDIQCPGPVFEYDYKDEKHFWITDVYYIPANLVIEVKDGGDNPNKRTMTTYREKQVAKEEMITKYGTYNYLRLTNNNFLQLLEILADIKYDIVEERKVKIRINENTAVGTGPMATLPSSSECDMYIIPYEMDSVFDIAVMNGNDSANCVVCKEGKLTRTSTSSVLKYPHKIYRYIGENGLGKFNKIKEISRGNKITSTSIVEVFLGHKPLVLDEIAFSNLFAEIDFSNSKNEIIKESLIYKMRYVMNENHSDKLVKDLNEDFYISHDMNGYFVHTDMPSNFTDKFIRSLYYESVSQIDVEFEIDRLSSILEEGWI